MSKKFVENFFRKWCLSDVMFRYFGSKNSKCLSAARMFSFEVRRNRKTPNGVKLNALQNGYLGFLIFFDFDPKNSKFRFFEKFAYKIQRFQAIQKTGIYVIDIHTNNRPTKFQSNIFVFGCAMAKKPGRDDDVTILKCNFWYF